MSAIRLRTTPKVDLPHYSYIFRKPEPLGTEMKNVPCSKLGTMLHLEIQNGKEAMKKSKFQSVLGGTDVCMKRMAIATKGCGQLTSTNTYFSDRWFSSVKTSEEMAAAGVDYCGPVKTSHEGFCLAMLEKLMKDWPGGSYLVLNITPIFPGERPLLAIGYNYNSRKVLGFIATEGARSTEPGDPYLSRFLDIYSNVSVRPFVFPHLLGRYFNACNAIDNHNRMRQSDLLLDKYWVTQSGYFILATTVALGMGIADGKLLYCHGVAEGNEDNKISTLEYNNNTVYDCFNNPFTAYCGSPAMHLPPITIDDRPPRIREPDMPQICSQLTFMLPLKTLLVP